jgi:hypothetical protein
MRAQSFGKPLMMVAGLSTDHASINSNKSLIGKETQPAYLCATFDATYAGPCGGLQLMPLSQE